MTPNRESVVETVVNIMHEDIKSRRDILKECIAYTDDPSDLHILEAKRYLDAAIAELDRYWEAK